jgi:hypothetical protein
MFKHSNNQNIVYHLYFRQMRCQTNFFNNGFIAERLKEYEYLRPRLDALRDGKSYSALSLGEYYLCQQAAPDDDNSITAVQFFLRGIKLGNTMCLDALVAMCEDPESTFEELKKKLASLPPKMVREIHAFISTHSMQTINQIVIKLLVLAKNNTDLISPEMLVAINEKLQYLSNLSHLPREATEGINAFIEKNKHPHISQLTI